MRMLLSTPYDPGEIDPGKSYTHVRIVDIHHIPHDDGGPGVPSMEMRVARGYLDPTDFKAGLTPVTIFRLEDGTPERTTHYTNLSADLANNGETATSAEQRVLYQWLIDEGHYAGTIESGN
jgi:hypothetical protein